MKRLRSPTLDHLIHKGVEIIPPERHASQDTGVIGYEPMMRMLQAAVTDAGGQAAFAATHNLSRAAVNHVTSGKRQPTDAILATIGLEHCQMYQKRAIPGDSDE